jgi:hypothetical protein
MSTPTVAKQLTDTLRQAGVERIYGVVGDSLNPVVDARPSPPKPDHSTCLTTHPPKPPTFALPPDPGSPVSRGCRFSRVAATVEALFLICCAV